MTVLERIRGDARPPNRDDVVLAKDFLSRSLGIRADFDLLDAAEQHELCDLCNRARWRGEGSRDGIDLNQLDRRQRKTFERIVEKAGGLPAGTFDRRRDDAKAQAKLAELSRRAKRPPQPRGGQEIALLTLLHEFVRDGVIFVDMLAVYAYALGALLAAEPPTAWSRIEGGGDDVALVFEKRMGLVGVDHDPYGEIGSRWERSLEHLATNGLLAVERSGGEYTVKIGRRTLAALRESK